jgi:hypothetical protein
MPTNKRERSPKLKQISNPCNEGCTNKTCVDEGCAHNSFRRHFEVTLHVPSLAKFQEHHTCVGHANPI